MVGIFTFNIKNSLVYKETLNKFEINKYKYSKTKFSLNRTLKFQMFEFSFLRNDETYIICANVLKEILK